VQALVSQSSQCRKLVNIFEMMPPVQRLQTSRQNFYYVAFPPSTQFVSPWTGGNPKQAPRRSARLHDYLYSDVWSSALTFAGLVLISFALGKRENCLESLEVEH
jgi:hypothetical protein